jgi:small-conductance mechanosensitive channel
MKKYIVAFTLIWYGSGLCYAQQPAQNLSLNSLEKQISLLDKEKSEVEKISQKGQQELASRALEQNTLKARRAAAVGKEQEFLSKKLSLITQDYQILSEIEQVRHQYKNLLEEALKLLREYKEDPQFAKLKMPVKASYGFEEFEELGRRVLSLKARLLDLEKSRAAASDDVHKRRKARATLEEEYQEKARQQQEFARVEPLEEEGRVQQGELIDLQKRLLTDKKTLADAKLKEAEQRIILLDTHSMIVRMQLATLKEYYENIKRALYVDAAHVQKAEAELERKRSESSSIREHLRTEIRAVDALQNDIRKKIQNAATQLNVSSSELAALREWEKTPQTLQEWSAVCSLGHLMLEEAVIDLDREYKEARIELEKAKLRQEELQVNIIKSWHALTGRRIGFTSHDLESQIKSYETPKVEIQGDLALLAEKRTRAITLLQNLNVLLERVKKLMGLLNERQGEFKEDSAQYEKCLQRMHEAEDHVRRRMYLTAKLIEVYSTAIAALEDTIKRIDNVIVELGTKSFWRRSALSLSWAELKNFSPDIRRFIEDAKAGLSAYIKTWNAATISQSFSSWLGHHRQPSLVMLLVLRVLIALLIFWIIRMYLPELKSYLAQSRYYFVRSSVRLFAVVTLDFISKHLVSLYLWLLLYLLIFYNVISNAYFSLIFYLASIPYMLFIAYRFVQHVMSANDHLGNVFVSPSYRSRFLLVVPPLLYVTIALFFFRQAFMVGSYHASAVPAILLAINYILLQLALMSLISKEWILSLIPRTTPLWEWLYDRVSRYYYLFWLMIIAIIIMSNPYVGYGRQVLYILSRLAILGLLLPLLSYIYSRIRHISADLFFYYSEGETVVERFGSARTWYGFFVIAIFCMLVIIGILLGAKVLGYTLSLQDIVSWFHYEIYSHVDEMGRRIAVTPIAFFKLVLFLIAGLTAAYIINNILLRRIFDPLLVSQGIQNTLFTFTRYATIFIALLLGFRSLGLQSFATQFVLVLGAVGFAVKDPLLDFFSYFIILVQRPIKIGDFIMLDDNSMGMVRHITPRSVILRRKNSVTVIVPNSYIITRPVVNWSYSPTFFALNDIMLTVPYAYDPDKVRSIILRVLDSNINILKTPAPLVHLYDFVDNGFQFMIRAYLTADKVPEQWEIGSQVRLEIVRALRQAQIEVASPTRILKVVQQPSADNLPSSIGPKV